MQVWECLKVSVCLIGKGRWALTGSIPPPPSPPLSVPRAIGNFFLIPEYKLRPWWHNSLSVLQDTHKFTHAYALGHEKWECKKNNNKKLLMAFSQHRWLAGGGCIKVKWIQYAHKVLCSFLLSLGLFTIKIFCTATAALEQILQRDKPSSNITEFDEQQWSFAVSLVVDSKLWALCERQKENRDWYLAGTQ